MSFLPKNFSFSAWEDLEPFFEKLKNYPLQTVPDGEKFISDWSELDAELDEDFAWRYIKMVCKNNEKSREKSYFFFLEHLLPPLQKVSHQLEKKMVGSEIFSQMPSQYRPILQKMDRSVKIFREKNIPLQTEEEKLSSEFGRITGAMTISYRGKALTMPQASQELENTDRSHREKIYQLMFERRQLETKKLDDLLTKLIRLRHQIALNAGFENFRDYMHYAKGREYSIEDVLAMHKAIETHFVPLLRAMHRERKKNMNLPALRPWDLSVDSLGRPPLKPFTKTDDLIEKTIGGFSALEKSFGAALREQKNRGFLDLDSRPHKNPGGFNYPLRKSGVPFIFMNSAGGQRDLATMVHEGGHAIHAFLAHKINPSMLQSVPIEAAELASMGMEFISMEAFWSSFYPNAEDLARAKRNRLEDTIFILPWIAQVDAFQHWIYANPNHSTKERKIFWSSLYDRFGSDVVDFSGFENAKNFRWQSQPHIFDVPFYYIEYAIAEMGAIGLWENYKKSPTSTIASYKKFLETGYQKPLSELYALAGVSFGTSPEAIKSASQIISNE